MQLSMFTQTMISLDFHCLLVQCFYCLIQIYGMGLTENLQYFSFLYYFYFFSAWVNFINLNFQKQGILKKVLYY